MTKEKEVVHVSTRTLLTILEHATAQKMRSAASVFVTPENSRNYGCAAPGCVRMAYAKGFCNAHYIRSQKGLSMEVPLRVAKREGRCSDCGALTGAKGGWGLCPKHYKKARYDAIKDAAISALGGSCAHCGGVFHRAVFDFHHHGDKVASPSYLMGASSLPAIAEELSKCILLCANCHRIEHHDEK